MSHAMHANTTADLDLRPVPFGLKADLAFACRDTEELMADRPAVMLHPQAPRSVRLVSARARLWRVCTLLLALRAGGEALEATDGPYSPPSIVDFDNIFRPMLAEVGELLALDSGPALPTIDSARAHLGEVTAWLDLLALVDTAPQGSSTVVVTARLLEAIHSRLDKALGDLERAFLGDGEEV